MKRSWTIASALVLVLLGIFPGRARADDESEYGRTPPRLGFFDGEVSFWRPGSDDWAPARINLPLAPGDAVYTGSSANLELQIGSLAFVRAGEQTQLTLSNQENDFIQFSMTSGHVAVDARSLPTGRVIEVDTPNAAIVVDRAGYYRVRVRDDFTTVVARRGGHATVTPANGEPSTLNSNEQALVERNDRVAVREAPDTDVWDRWNYDRTDQVANGSTGRYVPPGVYGADTLEQYGTWRNVAEYGWVWAPSSVDPGWVPYSAGSWIWDPSYGWTWVDNEPWGWAPAHYGRWVYANNYWAWAPGPVVVSPFYAPAVVAWFGGGVSVGVGFGAPYVSWVALGWGEPLYPWWGPVGFIGAPCWYGWGGPHHWDDHHGHDHHGDGHDHGNWNGHDHGNWNGHDHGVHDYQNSPHNAVLVSDHEHFGRGPVAGQRMPVNQAQQMAPVRGALPVKPVSASLAPQHGPAVRPPSNAVGRPVVATRQAQDPAPALRAAGLPPASAPRNPARVVPAAPQSASRGGPISGRSDSIDHGPVSAPRHGAPMSAPAPGAAPDNAPRARGSYSVMPPNNSPSNAPRSAPASRAPAPPMSAPRHDDRGAVQSVPAPSMQAPRGTHNDVGNAPRNAERAQPPLPHQPRSYSNTGPGMAPREAPRPYSGPMNAPRAEMPSHAPPPPMHGPSGPSSAPMSAPHGGGGVPSGGPAGGSAGAPAGGHTGGHAVGHGHGVGSSHR